MLLLIDNFDSFTYNIVSSLEKFGKKVCVVRRGDPLPAKPEGLIIGPGPGHPLEMGFTKDLLAFAVPILGICMGHQVLATLFGGTVGPARQVMHGKRSLIYHDGAGLFTGLEQPFLGMRYHSLAVTRVPSCLQVSAKTACGEVMGLRHRDLPIESVQFHPDSVGTAVGMQIFENYILKSLPR